MAANLVEAVPATAQRGPVGEDATWYTLPGGHKSAQKGAVFTCEKQEQEEACGPMAQALGHTHSGAVGPPITHTRSQPCG